METLMLLFGMMVIVSIFSETGFFDSCALQVSFQTFFMKSKAFVGSSLINLPLRTFCFQLPARVAISFASSNVEIFFTGLQAG
jgi:hypothetical protein